MVWSASMVQTMVGPRLCPQCPQSESLKLAGPRLA